MSGKVSVNLPKKIFQQQPVQPGQAAVHPRTSQAATTKENSWLSYSRFNVQLHELDVRVIYAELGKVGRDGFALQACRKMVAISLVQSGSGIR